MADEDSNSVEAGAPLPGLPELPDCRGPQVRTVIIDEDLYNDDRPETEIPPLDTDLSLLPPHKGKFPRNKYSDGIRYNEFVVEYELKYYEKLAP